MKRSFKTFNSALAFTALVLCALYNGSVNAATPGTLGADSTGTVDISVDKPELVQISGMADMSITNYRLGDGAQSVNTTVCVYSSTASGGYDVTISGSGAADAFTLASGGNTLAYTVEWNSAGAGSIGTGGSAATTGTPLTARTNASTTSFLCNANANPTAQLNVNFSQVALEAAPAGTYTGTVTVLVAPN